MGRDAWALRRRLGNTAWQQLVLAKRSVSHPDDADEREADQVADAVPVMPDPAVGIAAVAPPAVQRLCPACPDDLHRRAPDALAPDRRAPLSIATTPATQTPPGPASCALPVRLGHARGCAAGSGFTPGADFGHFDSPSISTASAAKLAAWATARPFSRGPFRSLVTDTECELEMDRELVLLGRGAGHAAFSRFAAGTGGTQTHGPTSTLGAMALASGSFARTVARVRTDIEAQLAGQATSGALDPCALAVTPPATHFAFSDGTPLKAVIGGTQGEELRATGFTASLAARSYSIDLRFSIFDDFGVDEADLYSPGLCAFWVLQHERSPTRYAPFVNALDLPVTVSGTF